MFKKIITAILLSLAITSGLFYFLPIIPQKNNSISVIFNLIAHEQDTFTIYYDAGEIKKGNAFNQKNSISVYVNAADTVQSIRFDLPNKKLKGFRFDPGEISKIVKIQSLLILYNNKEIEKLYSAEIKKYFSNLNRIENYYEKDGMLYIETQFSDPQLTAIKSFIKHYNNIYFKILLSNLTANYYSIFLTLIFFMLIIFYLQNYYVLLLNRLLSIYLILKKRKNLLILAISLSVFFILILKSNLNNQKNSLLKLVIETQANKVDVFSLYFNTGKLKGYPYSQENQIGRRVNANIFEKLSYVLPDKKILGIRFDPGEEIAENKIKSISIERNNDILFYINAVNIDKYFSSWDRINSFGYKNGSFVLKANGTDPQFQTKKELVDLINNIRQYNNDYNKIKLIKNYLLSFLVSIIFYFVLLFALFLLKSKRTKTLLIINLLTIIFLAAISFKFKDTIIKSNSYSNIDYDSNSKLLSNVIEFNENEISEDKEVDISFKMKLYDKNDYYNVFQTGDGNDGIRLEVVPPNRLGLILGKNTNGEIKGYFLLSDLQNNLWYDVKINVDKNMTVTASINNDKSIWENSAFSTFKYDISKIAIGAGFSKSRKFNGIIKDFSINYTLLTRNMISIVIDYLLKILILSLFCFLGTIYFDYIKIYYIRLKEYIFLNQSFLIGLLGVILVVGIYNLFIYNKYFPISEGWYSVYADYILKGKIPYRDFYLVFTPLYTLQIAEFIKIFGYSIIKLRILGFFIIVSIASLLYVLYRRLFNSYIALLAAVLSIIYYESDITNINYDYVQFFTLYSLIAAYCLIKFIENSSLNKRFIIYSGMFASFAFLVKQNFGFFTIFSLYCAAALLSLRENFKILIKNSYKYALGVFIPVFIVLIFLYTNNALHNFINQTFFGAVKAKGDAGPILYAWIGRLFTAGNISLLKSALYVISILILFNFLFNKYVLKGNNSAGSKNKDFIALTLFSFSLVLIVVYPYVNMNLNTTLLYSNIINKFYFSIVISVTVLTIASFFFLSFASIIKNKTKYDKVLIYTILSMGLLYGAGTSAAVCEGSAYFGFGIIAGYLVKYQNKYYNPGKIFILIMYSMLIMFMVTKKYKDPYLWWGLSQPDVRTATTKANIKYLNGYYLDQYNVNILSDVKNLIENNSNKNDSIYVFPHMPIFYLLTGRYPDTFALVHWFDVSPDSVVKADADIILKSPPKIIVMLDVPEIAWIAHEKGFRKGKPSGQREIVRNINKLTANNKYKLLKKYYIPTNYELKVWVRSYNA